MENNGGSIHKFKRHKGYESVSRDFLQHCDLGTGAIGLLGHIISLPDYVELKKVNLYDKFPQKRKSIESDWTILVAHGYILQFRKATRRSSTYTYLVSDSKFEEHEVAEKVREFEKSGYKLYVNKKQKELIEKLRAEEKAYAEKALDFVKNEPKNTQVKPDLEKANLTDVRNEHLLKNEGKSTDVRNEHLLETAPNQQSQQMFPKNSSCGTLSNRFKELGLEEDDYLIYINNVSEKSKFQSIKKYLNNCGVTEGDSLEIMNQLVVNPELADFELIVNQMNWCIEKSATEQIISMPLYFMNGLRLRFKSRQLQKGQYAETNLYANDSKNDGGESAVNVPLFNWLED